MQNFIQNFRNCVVRAREQVQNFSVGQKVKPWPEISLFVQETLNASLQQIEILLGFAYGLLNGFDFEQLGELVFSLDFFQQ